MLKECPKFIYVHVGGCRVVVPDSKTCYNNHFEKQGLGCDQFHILASNPHGNIENVHYIFGVFIMALHLTWINVGPSIEELLAYRKSKVNHAW